MSGDIFQSEQTAVTGPVVITDIITPNTIRKEHQSIAADLIQRVQMLLDRAPTIESYAVIKDYFGNPKERLKLKLDKAILEIELSRE